MSSIFLNMIVKNEAKIIERCLDEVSWIDGLVISDTGSTDDTIEVIEAWRKRHNKLGTVVQNPWKNFGHNRNEALIEARKWCAANGLDLTKTYFLMIDADMIFTGGKKLRNVIDQADLWDIRQQNATIIYHNLRVVRASLDVVCKCPTHEYYDILTPGATRKTFEDAVIEDIGDGGSKSDKAERDIRLLKEALTTEPKNCRYWFYLANTYRDIRDFANAILAYHQRIEIGGWFEETFCATVYKGDCHMALGQISEAITMYLSAYQIDPQRSESLIRLATFYRANSHHHLAMLFIEKGLKIMMPPDRLLFVEKQVYDWRFLYEMSISAYYLKDVERGRLACKMLLEKTTLPDHIRESTVKNLEFYEKS